MLRTAAIALGIFLVGVSACHSLRKGDDPKPPLSRCNEELGAISEAAAALKPRKTSGEPDNDSLQGLRISLTINGMISLKVDPTADLDDWCYSQNTRENFDKLVGTLKQRKMPPTVAFSAGKRLDEAQVLEWLRSGNIIGNMTFERRKLKKVSTSEFIADIEKETEYLAKFSSQFPQQKRYFRYPLLKGARDPEKQTVISTYLKKQGYLEAPFTIQGKDDRFSQIYCSALARGDQSCANLVKAVFKSVLIENVVQARTVAATQTGHDLRQVLMVGANQLICDTLGEVLDQFAAMGVQFIPLDEALADPFYSRSDVWAAARRIGNATRRAIRSEIKQP